MGMVVSRGSANDSIIPFGMQASFAPADSTTYYFGLVVQTVTQGVNRIYFPRAGVITQCYIRIVIAGTLGTSETATISIRKNSTTDTTVSAAVTYDAAAATFSNTALSIAIAAGDYIEYKVVTPAWVTNPTGVFHSGMLYFQ